MRIVHEGPDELVVVKPAGMPAELSDDRQGVSLLSRMKAEYGPEMRLCHRLDRPTVGFVVVARSKAAAAFHGDQLARRQWRKFYLARVAHPERVTLGLHQTYLKERGQRVDVVRSGGQPARLEVLGVEGPHVLLELFTGRRHQVRVMLAACGAPLVGDALYGGPPGNFYLEHVLLRFPTAQGPVVCYLPERPERVGPRLVAQLESLVARLRAGADAGQG